MRQAFSAQLNLFIVFIFSKERLTIVKDVGIVMKSFSMFGKSSEDFVSLYQIQEIFINDMINWVSVMAFLGFFIIFLDWAMKEKKSESHVFEAKTKKIPYSFLNDLRLEIVWFYFLPSKTFCQKIIENTFPLYIIPFQYIETSTEILMFIITPLWSFARVTFLVQWTVNAGNY